MNYLKVMLATITVLFLSSFHATAMGFLPPENLSEAHEPDASVSTNVATEVDFGKCLSYTASDGVCYISGGISGDEVAQFKSHAKEYLLEIVFVQKADTEDNGRIEEYLAEVQLQIKDAKGNVVVDTITEGPFFLANLPPGKYQITADYAGVIKNNAVNISAKKHQRIVFLWPR
jgi:hypothetical protein